MGFWQNVLGTVAVLSVGTIVVSLIATAVFAIVTGIKAKDKWDLTDEKKS